MKKESRTYSLLPYWGYFIFLLLIGCKGQYKKVVEPKMKNASTYQKPGSTYQASLHVNQSAAVFYHPDSLQLLQIKEAMDSSIYDSNMHELFYQIRNARLVIKKYWPEIKIIESKNVRFLVFHKKDGEEINIDLDNKYDTYGLLLFNQIKDPELADMTNIETVLSNYFTKQ